MTPSLPRLNRTRALPILLLAGLALPAAAAAQVRASERGATVQTIDGTTITIDYSRPVARGRPELFGGIIHWGDVWTPGANWATTLEADRTIRLNGNEIPAGKYSVWMVPGQEEWTVILHRDVRLFHTDPPEDQTGEILRFPVRPEQGPHMETLSFYFPVIGRNEAKLRMHWGTTIVPMDLAVQATRPAALAAEDAGPYIGRYALTFLEGGPPMPIAVDLFVEDGRLRGRFGGSPPDMDPQFDLVPVARDRFHPAYYRNGELHETDLETIMVFTVENDRATGFQFMFEGEPYATATRQP